MKIAMLGGGMVGQTLAGKLLSNGHEVTIGIRSAAAAELSKPRNFADTLQDWVNEFERVQLLLRLSTRLRQKHGD